MNSVSEDIKEFLLSYGESSGLDLVGDPIYIGDEPTSPINCITIFDSGGYPPDLGLMIQGYERPSMQIRVRNKKYLDGIHLAQRIKDALHGQAQITIGGTLYSVIQCTSGPAHLDWDNNRNARFFINFNIQRRAV